jgi:hypothetical protein
MVMRRFDSNFDGELSYSDVSDMFSPRFNLEAIQEFEKRQMFGKASGPDHQFEADYIKDHVRDVFESIILVMQIAENIQQHLRKTPSFSIREALNILKHREHFSSTMLTRYI